MDMPSQTPDGFRDLTPDELRARAERLRLVGFATSALVMDALADRARAAGSRGARGGSGRAAPSAPVSAR